MREGHCTVGCGACCRFIRLQVNPQYLSLADVQNWIELHGIKLREVNGGVFAYIPIPCTALTPEGLCGLYDKPERPILCGISPVGPEELDELKFMGADCTYSFPQGK